MAERSPMKANDQRPFACSNSCAMSVTPLRAVYPDPIRLRISCTDKAPRRCKESVIDIAHLRVNELLADRHRAQDHHPGGYLHARPSSSSGLVLDQGVFLRGRRIGSR